MRLVFIFNRLNDNKWHGPLVREALSQGDEVECWLDYRDISQTTKWYEFPAEESLPRYHESKTPIYRKFKSQDELAKLGRESNARVIFSTHPPLYPKPAGQIWAHVAATFYDCICGTPAQDFKKFDIVFFNTQHWIEESIEYYKILGQLEPKGTLEDEFRSKWVVTGTPQFDHFEFCNRSEIRKHLNIPEGKRLVVMFGMEMNLGFWCQRIFLEHSRWRRLFHVLAMPFSYPGIYGQIGKRKILKLFLKSFVERWEFLREAFTSSSEEDVIAAIRQFCDSNNAIFLMKARRKHILKEHHRRVPNILIEGDESYLPSTPAMVMSAADLLISFYSTSAAEAASAGIPVLNLRPPKNRYYAQDQFELMYLTDSKLRGSASARYYHNIEGGLFQTKHLVETWTVNDVVQRLPKTSLGHFTVDPTALKTYREKYITHPEGASSPRILAEIHKRFG